MESPILCHPGHDAHGYFTSGWAKEQMVFGNERKLSPLFEVPLGGDGSVGLADRFAVRKRDGQACSLCTFLGGGFWI